MSPRTLEEAIFMAYAHEAEERGAWHRTLLAIRALPETCHGRS